MFTKAERTDTFIKLALTGPSGSGKTYSALRLARGLVGSNGRIAFVDTENRSGTLYSHLTEFYHYDLAPPFDYRKFMEACREAEKAGFDCVIFDSASHLWQGILEDKTNIDRRGGNQFTNWMEPTRHFNEVIQTFLQSRIHTISCMRSKTDYILQTETNSKGKDVQTPKKVGMAPVMREGVEYEFTVAFEIAMDHCCTPSKDRTGLFTNRPFLITEETGEMIKHWLVEAKPQEHSTETDKFLALIHNADTKDTLKGIAAKIKESTLPESQKRIIRTLYKEKFNIVV